MKLVRLLCAIWMTLILAACASQRPRMDYDPSAMFSGYRTFMWMPREHHPARNRAVSARAQEAIEAELVSKGFSRAADAGSADFAIDFTIGPQDRIDVQTYPRPYFVPDEAVYSEWWAALTGVRSSM